MFGEPATLGNSSLGNGPNTSVTEPAQAAFNAAQSAAAGGPVVGICNGVQVLTEAGLLPGALQKNRGLRFVCTTVSVRARGSSRSPTKQGASSAAIALSPTSMPFKAASASEASSPEPTSVTSQPCAKSRISARVYSRCTVPLVPSTETRLVLDLAQAGLMAGTVPTNGTG